MVPGSPRAPVTVAYDGFDEAAARNLARWTSGTGLAQWMRVFDDIASPFGYDFVRVTDHTARHEGKVARVVAQLRTRTGDRPVSLKKKAVAHQVPKPGDLRRKDDKIDISDLTDILEIDPVRRVCVAESGVAFNEALATQKLTEAASIEAKLMGEQFRLRQEMLSILTPEQKTQMEQQREQFKGHHGEGRGGRNEQREQQQQ